MCFRVRSSVMLPCAWSSDVTLVEWRDVAEVYKEVGLAEKFASFFLMSSRFCRALNLTLASLISRVISPGIPGSG